MALAPSCAQATTIRAVEIAGLRYSSEALVRRELPFHVGDRWRPEWVTITEKRLLALGVFSEVHVVAPDAKGVVRIVVHDRWPLWILPTATRKDTGASWLGIAVHDYNVRGLAHEAHLEVRNYTGTNFSSWQRVRDGRLAYYWRRLAASDLSLRVEGTISSAPGARSEALAVALVRSWGESPELGPKLALGMFRQQKTGRNGYLAWGLDAGVVWRDVFEHVDWQEGARAELRLRATPRWIRTSTRWEELSGVWARYWPMDARGDTLNVRMQFHLRRGDLARLGYLDPSGGRGLRGYYPGEVPAKAWIMASLEPRWRVPKAENVQLVGFVDWAWVKQARWQGVGALGLGLRWTLRWLAHGTLRLDFGYGLGTRRWRVHLGTGQAF